jgi:hypothetical protein
VLIEVHTHVPARIIVLRSHFSETELTIAVDIFPGTVIVSRLIVKRVRTLTIYLYLSNLILLSVQKRSMYTAASLSHNCFTSIYKNMTLHFIFILIYRPGVEPSPL